MTMLAEHLALTAANDYFRLSHEATRKDCIVAAERITPPIAEFLPPDAVIAVGFGIATLTRDGEVVYEERSDDAAGPIMVAQADELAKAYPEHDWCIHLIALLEDRHFRRVGPGWWKLYRRGYGLS